MDARVAEFRKLAGKHGAGQGARPMPYPSKCHELAVSYARDQTASGVAQRAVARTLGVAPQTLDCWCKAQVKSVKRVRVTAGTASLLGAMEPTVVMPNGARVEGLGVDGVIAVLRALG